MMDTLLQTQSSLLSSLSGIELRGTDLAPALQSHELRVDPQVGQDARRIAEGNRPGPA